MRPLQAHCHLGLGKLCRRIGRVADARTELSAAITLLDDLQMALWLPEARGPRGMSKTRGITTGGGRQSDRFRNLKWMSTGELKKPEGPPVGGPFERLNLRASGRLRNRL